MRRHLWTSVTGWALGVGLVAAGGTAAWGQQPGVSPNGQQGQAGGVVYGGGGVSAQAPRDMIHVPAWTPKGPPGGPEGAMPHAVVIASDPGIWQEKSWICWWAINRDAVLERVMAKRASAAPVRQPAAGVNAPPPPERAEAVAALMKATQAASPELRGAAAVSLGQMRQADALKTLVGLGQKDGDAYVRGMAWLGVGLVGNAEAEKALLSVRPRDEFEQLGVIAGIGMLERPGEPAFQLLRELVSKPPSPEVGRAAVWALRVFHRAADHDLLAATAAPANGFSPLRSEALLALGALGDPRDVKLLVDAATDGHAADAADQVITPGADGGYVRRAGRYVSEPAPVQTGTAVVGGQTAGVIRRRPVSAQAAAGRTPVARTSAALALGPSASATGRGAAAGGVQVENAMIQNFAPYLDQGGPMYAGASLLAFSSGVTPKDVYLLRDLVDMGTDPVLGLVNPRSPLRAYAAIGLGLYMANGGAAKIETRPLGTVQVGVDAGLPDYIDLNETLAIRYANRQEAPDFRAACALALGLSGDPANVQRLMKGAQQLNRRDELVLGYTVLALAMLHDKDAVNAAGPLLASGAAGRIDADAVAMRGLGQVYPAPASLVHRPGAAAGASPFDPPAVPQTGPALLGVLGRRAALVGLSLLDDPRTDAILAGAWARDRSTYQDVARVMGWCHDYKPAEALAQVVTRGQKGAVEAAASLGWVFDPDRPSRLSRLVVGNNYHQPQTDWSADNPSGTEYMVRNFPRVADLFLYSTALGGQPIAAHRANAAPATPRRTVP